MKKIVLLAVTCMMLLVVASSGMLEQDDEAVVNCSGQKLGNARAKEILDQIKHPELVREINLSHCEITSASELPLNRFVNLKKLDFSHNELQRVTIRQLPQLQELDLYDNELKQVNLRQLPQLQQFVLKHSSIQQIDLSNLLSLKILNLSNNNLQQIHISQLPQLEQFELTYSQIQQIDVSQLPSLKILNLFNNQLKQVDLRLLPQLQQLNLSDNQLQQVAVIQLPQLKYLNFCNNQLKQVDLRLLPQLQILDLFGNQLQRVNVSLLPGLQKLQLSHNKLEQVYVSQLPELQKLYLSNNQLQRVDLNQLPQLNELSLSGNTQLGGAGLKEILDQIQNVQLVEEIYLNNCDIASTDILQLNRFVNLKKLSLSRNRLEQIDLSQLSSLQELDLSGNELCPVFVIKDLMELKSIVLIDTNVKNLQLKILPKLKFICINDNKDLERLFLLEDVQSIQEINYNRANPNCKIIVEGGRLPKLNKLETDHKKLFDHISMPLIRKNIPQQEEVLEDKIFLKENQRANKKAPQGNLLNKIEQKKEEIAALHKKMYSIEAGVAAVLDQQPVNNPEFEAAKKAREQQEQEAREYREKQE